MKVTDNFILLTPEYEKEYERRYGKQPKFIPVDFITNSFIPPIVYSRSFMSRTWTSNPKYKKQ